LLTLAAALMLALLTIIVLGSDRSEGLRTDSGAGGSVSFSDDPSEGQQEQRKMPFERRLRLPVNRNKIISRQADIGQTGIEADLNASVFSYPAP
jgi:hypothetical protein